MKKKKTSVKVKSEKKEINDANRSLLYIIITAVVLIALMCVFWISRGTYSLDSGDRIELVCPDSEYGPGDEVTCNVVLYSPNTTTLSVNANYVLPDGISYSGFNAVTDCGYPDLCFMELAATSNGFAVGNVTGWTHADTGLVVGALKVRLGNNVESNSTYNIGLTNIELSDSTYTMHEYTDVTAQIATKSNNTSVTGVSLEFKKCSSQNSCTSAAVSVPEFNEETIIYNVSVDADVNRVIFTFVKDDENATVTVNGQPFINLRDCTGGDTTAPDCGDPHTAIGTANLHYGTNTLELVVTANNGVSSKTYTYTVTRAYEFSTTVYTYDANNNYIYTSGDTGNTIIASLGQPEEGLNYSINNNKLVIKYNQELLKSIDIVHFNMNYVYDRENIYIANKTSLSDFMSNLSGSGLTFKVFNGSTQITDNVAMVDDGYKVKIYYGNRLLETFDVVVAPLSFSDEIVVDTTNMILKRIEIGKTVEWLGGKVDTTGTVKVIDKTTREELSQSDKLKTGDKLVIMFNGVIKAEYEISVLGDVIGNGQVKINDVAVLYGFIKGRRELTLAQQFAGNVINTDESIKINDVGKLYRYVKGRIDSLED